MKRSRPHGSWRSRKSPRRTNSGGWVNTDSKEEPMEVPEDQSHPPVESGDAADLDTATTVIHHHAKRVHYGETGYRTCYL